MASVRMKVSAKEIRNAVKEKVTDPIIALTKNPDVLRSIANEALDIVEPYVPMKDGVLRASGHIVQHARSTTIVWGRPGAEAYAQYQHDADDSTWKRTTPGTKSHWTDEIAPGSPGFNELVDYASTVMKKEI